MIAAQIAIQTGAASILTATFIGQRSIHGRPDDQVQEEVEPLQSRGVDGTSHRSIGRQWRPWLWETVMGATDYQEACRVAAALETMQGSTAAIVLHLQGGVLRTYSQVRVLEVVAQAQAGGLIVAGPPVASPFAGTGAQPQASITARWRLQLAAPGTWNTGDDQ